jgi:hypothetical protein
VEPGQTGAGTGGRVNGQLALLPEAPPKLTDKQRYILDAVQRAGPDGLQADEAGALWCELHGRHSAGDRCQFDGSSGKAVLHSLRAKGLVRYRGARGQQAGAWLPVGVVGEVETSCATYNQFPEGF